MAHHRWPLVCYIALFIVGFILLTVASRPVINRYITHQVVKRYEVDQICRKGGDPEACRNLLDRISKSVDHKQRRKVALRLFHSLTEADKKELGLRGPRGPRGPPGRSISDAPGAPRTHRAVFKTAAPGTVQAPIPASVAFAG